MRFGVGDGSEHTLEESARTSPSLASAIRQIEPRRSRKLRHPSRSRKLEGVLEGRT
jgi:RNA polymerase primary sigma factor